MTTLALLTSIRDHLATFELPEPWNVSVHTSAFHSREQIAVHLDSSTLPITASALLTWADTLTSITAEAWRVPDGSSVHLAVRGRLEDGTTVEVFGGVPHDQRFRLDEAERRPISFAVLREWAALGGEVAA